MSSTGTTTSSRSSLRDPASTMVTGRAPSAPWPPRKRAISSSGRCVAERPMRCGGRCGDLVEPLQAQHQVRAPLGGCHRVDLVDDHVLDRPQRLPCARRQHQVERFRRRDEDVGRRADERLSFLAGRVAGPHRNGRHAQRGSEPFGCEADAGERRAQVLLDVDGERAQRRDVEHAATFGLGWFGSGREAVDRPQERGQRLPRAGGSEDQRVVSVGDRRPPGVLRRGGRGEARLEPRPYGFREALHRHGPTVPTSPDRECQVHLLQSLKRGSRRRSVRARARAARGAPAGVPGAARSPVRPPGSDGRRDAAVRPRPTRRRRAR